MTININEWLNSQEENFKLEIGNLREYLTKGITLKELEALDNKFINNSPEGEVI